MDDRSRAGRGGYGLLLVLTLSCVLWVLAYGALRMLLR
jgi:hypothetical protein